MRKPTKIAKKTTATKTKTAKPTATKTTATKTTATKSTAKKAAVAASTAVKTTAAAKAPKAVATSAAKAKTVAPKAVKAKVTKASVTKATIAKAKPAKASKAKASKAKAAKAKAPAYRLNDPSLASLNKPQQKLRDAIASGPRGEFIMEGPFAIYMHAPEFGMLAQELGGFCRLETSVPPRLSELAILVTARHWRAQYEWFAHAPIAARQGVKPATIKAIKSGRRPVAARPDERAVYDFVTELYGKRRVSDATYKKVQKVLGDKALVELVGILGYYASVSMQLNAFHSALPEGEPLAFREG